MRQKLLVIVALLALLTMARAVCAAAELTVALGNARDVTMVGAMQRWDGAGNPRRLPDVKAQIDKPTVDAVAVERGPGRWVFQNLPQGAYDLVILTGDRRRFEGFQYAPVKECDPFFAPDAAVDEETRQTIGDDVRQAPHFENRVEPLGMAGDKQAVRVLVMLIRDKPTSYEKESPGAATVRHEIWQYSWNYGVWQKERRTRVLDRILLPRDELRRWTWLWDPKLGGIAVGAGPTSVRYELSRPAERTLPGLYPR